MANSRILIVDDEIEVCHLLESLLDELDPEIHMVHAADEAMAAVGTFRPDLVITDLRMPGGSGFDVLKAAKEFDVDLPVVIITGYGSMETAIEAMRLGAFDYVTKPFNLDEVRLTVERGLESRDLRSRNRRLTEIIEASSAGQVHLTGILATMVRLIQDHGGYKIGHAERVRRHVGAMASAAGKSDDERARWEEAAALADIGEVSIPVRIWQQRGHLSPEQMALVRRHPVKGQELLIRSGMNADLAAIVRHHHEDWDGNGYPDGITGEEIPEAARAISIAASFDAMTTPRLYRQTVSAEDAIESLKAKASASYDPELVKIFVNSLTEAASGETG